MRLWSRLTLAVRPVLTSRPAVLKCSEVILTWPNLPSSCAGRTSGKGQKRQRATLVHGAGPEGARGRARTKTRMEVTIEKKTPKPNTMPLHEGRSARQEPSHVVRVVRLRDMQAGLGYRAGLGWVETGWSAHKPAASGMRQPEAAAGGAESAVGRV